MTCNVTGTAISPNGLIKPGARITFRRAQLDVVSQEGSFVIPDDYIIQTASDGTVDFDILPGVYDATTVAVGVRNVAFRVSVPDEPAADFADLLNASYVEIPPASVTQAQQARDEAEAAAAQAALYDGPWLDTVAALLADTTLSYTAGQPTTVADGDYVRTRAEGFSYQVAASGATDQHVTTAGGVKLYSLQPNVIAFGAAGDGVTDDSAAFLAAFAVFPSADFDLQGKTYRVTAVPSGRYRNGFWLIIDGDEGADVRLPAKDTLRGDALNISGNNRYSAWPQDKCHTFRPIGTTNAGARELIFAAWNEAQTHDTVDQSLALARSWDGGSTFREYEHPFQVTSPATAQSAWSMGVIDGQQLVIVRSATSPGEYSGHRLYGRRLYERRTSSITFSTTSGSTLVTATLPERHGLKNGDRINISQFTPSLGGQNPSGAYVITRIDAFAISFNLSAAATSTESGVRSVIVEFLEDAFSEILIGGAQFNAAFLTAGAASGWTVAPTMFHSFAASGDDFYTCVHGGTGNPNGPWLVRVSNVLGSASFGLIARIGGLTQGVESTVAVDPDTGDAYGIVRSQSTSYPIRSWHYNGSVFSTRDFPGTFGRYAPWPIAIHEGRVYGQVTGTRNRDDNAGPVSAYLSVWDSLADFRAGFSGCKLIQYTSLYFSRTNFNFTGNAVGVGSVVVTREGDVILFHSDEHPAAFSDLDGQPDTYAVRLTGYAPPVSNQMSVQSFTGPGAIGLRQNQVQREIRLYAAISGVTGNIIFQNAGEERYQLTSSKSGTGVYLVGFANRRGEAVSIPNGERYVVTVTGAANPRYSAVYNRGASGFEIRTFNDAGAAADLAALVEVIIPLVFNKP